MEAFARNLFGLVLFFSMVSILLAWPASAADFTASISPSSVNGSLSNQMFNVTINNTDSSKSIIRVNVTLPPGFVFVGDSNQTSASNTVFSNTSTVLTWSNSTPSGFIDNGTVEFFSFNSSTPSSSGNKTITVYLLDTNYSSNSTNLVVTVDADYPGVVLSYPGNNTNHTNSSMTFNFTATDQVDGNITCNLTIDGSVNQSGFGALSGSMTSRSVAGLNKGKHSWNVTCWDDFNHVTTSGTRYFGLYPDLIVTAMEWSSTPNNQTGAGSDVTFKATINNTAPFDASEGINVSLWWGNTLVDKKENVSDLTAGSSQVITFSQITNDSIVTNGLHSIRVQVDSGGDVSEANETNNNKTIQFLVGYNVTITSVNGTSSPYLMANKTFTINISVRYANGDIVTDIAEANLTHVYDNYGGGSPERDWGTTGYQGTSLAKFDNLTGGDYSFTIATYYNPTGPGPGVHNLTVSVERGNYSGSSDDLDYYRLLVPSFSVSFGSLMTSINEEYSDGFSIYATNTGTAVLYNSTASINDNHDYLTFTSCSGSATVINDSNQYAACNPTMTALAVTADQDGCFSANVSGRSNGLLFYSLSTLQCVAVLNVVTGTGPTTGPTGTTCTTDANCASGYYCSAGVCVKKTYSVAITSYAGSISVNWSSYVTTRVTVKNDGQSSLTAKLGVTLSGLTVSVLPESMSLDPGNSIIFTVNISVPGTAVIGNHSGIFKAFVNEDTSVYQSKPFTLSVLPTLQKEVEINETHYNFSAILKGLRDRFDKLKAIGFINQSDLDEIEDILDSITDDLSQVKISIDGKDYSTADSILGILNATLNSTSYKISGLEVEQQGLMGGELSGVWLWVVIGIVVVIVIGFLVYLFMPSLKGYHPRYGYKPVIREGLFEKLGKRFGRKPEKFRKPEEAPKTEFKPAYREGYEKLASGYHRGRGAKSNVKEKLGRIFKRKKKQKEVSEYFASGGT